MKFPVLVSGPKRFRLLVVGQRTLERVNPLLGLWRIIALYEVPPPVGRNYNPKNWLPLLRSPSLLRLGINVRFNGFDVFEVNFASWFRCGLWEEKRSTEESNVG